MKLKRLGAWLLMAAMCFLFWGCQTMDEEVPAEEAGSLRVKARSLPDAEVVYPMFLYAFSGNGACVASQTVRSSEETMRLELPAGKYRVVLVAGDTEDYQIPENPDMEDEIVLDNSTGAATPLLMGMADVEIGSEAEVRLELALAYAVSALDLSVVDVPSDVSAVTVTMSSFYSSLAFSGTYGREGHSLVLPCSQGEDKVWSAGRCYVFPGSASETVFSILLKKADGTEEAYGYTWQEVMKAGCPYSFTANYSSGVSLNGSFVVKGWNEQEEVAFQFGAGHQPETPGGEVPESSVVEVAELPQLGSIWNGAAVVGISEVTSEGADVLLLSLDEWSLVTSEVEEVMAGYNVNGFTGWRLPVFEEAKLLRDNYGGSNRTELNELISEYDETLVGIDGKERYLCDKSGVYYSYIFSAGTTITQAGEKRAYNVRFVKTVKCQKVSK